MCDAMAYVMGSGQWTEAGNDEIAEEKKSI